MRSKDIPSDLKNQLNNYNIDPKDIVIYINSSCNLRCLHCYIGDDLLRKNTSFSTESIINFILSFSQLDRITIIGGEPLLHSGINEIISHLGKLKTNNIRITTNLTEITRINISKLENTNITLSVSLDGDIPEIHDTIRGLGCFNKTVKNIRNLISRGVNIEIVHTIMKNNIGRFGDFVKFVDSIGVEKINLHRMSLHGNAIDNRDLQVLPDEWVFFCNEMSEGTGKNLVGVSVRYPVLFTTIEQYEHLLNIGEYHHHTHSSYYSVSNGKRVVLYPDGRIYISSEAFGTNSYIGDISGEDFTINLHQKNEISLSINNSEPVIEIINPLQSGSYTYPVVLSVSYKKSVTI